MSRASGIWAGIIVLVLGVGWAAVSHFHIVPYTIRVDGKPIVNVESRSTARKVLADVRLQRAGNASGSVRFVEGVAFHQAEANADISELPEAVRALEKAVSIEAESFAIIVDDKPVVALPRKADAEKALDLVKRFYERKVKAVYSNSGFKENVFVDKRYVEAGRLRSTPQDAVSALTTTSEKPKVHVVERGDRAVHLLRRYNISMAQIKSLNPGVDPERITEGDVLTIQLPKLPITVVCKSTVTETVEVTPPAGVRYGPRTGTRVSKMLVTYENGQRVSEEVISQVTTWDRPAPNKYSRSHRSRSTSVKRVTGSKPAKQRP